MKLAPRSLGTKVAAGTLVATALLGTMGPAAHAAASYDWQNVTPGAPTSIGLVEANLVVPDTTADWTGYQPGWNMPGFTVLYSCALAGGGYSYQYLPVAYSYHQGYDHMGWSYIRAVAPVDLNVTTCAWQIYHPSWFTFTAHGSSTQIMAPYNGQMGEALAWFQAL